MPRTYHKKGVHTNPENAGVKNLQNAEGLPKDEDGLNKKLLPIYKQGQVNRGIYKGQWSAEQLAQAISELFDYCNEVELKPTQPMLRLWLGVDRSTLWEWRTKPEKYGVKSNIIQDAFEYMEMYLQANIDKYPTGSAFLLRTSFGHVETSKVDVQTNTTVTSAEDMNDVISKLGLDKKE